PPGGGVRLPGLHGQALPGPPDLPDGPEVAHHAEQEGDGPKAAGTARGVVATQRPQRPRRSPAAQPDHPGLGQLLPPGGGNRPVVASAAFARMDDWMHRRAVRYVKRRHPNKPWAWCQNRYWGRLNPEREDRWVFGDKPGGAYLLKFRWFKIVRHRLVRGRASPAAPRRPEYWSARRQINFP